MFGLPPSRLVMFGWIAFLLLVQTLKTDNTSLAPIQSFDGIRPGPKVADGIRSLTNLARACFLVH